MPWKVFSLTFQGISFINSFILFLFGKFPTVGIHAFFPCGLAGFLFLFAPLLQGLEFILYIIVCHNVFYVSPTKIHCNHQLKTTAVTSL